MTRLRKPRGSSTSRQPGTRVTVIIGGQPHEGRITTLCAGFVDVELDEPAWTGAGRFSMSDEGLTWCLGRKKIDVATLRSRG